MNICIPRLEKRFLPQLDSDVCNLGSINIPKHIKLGQLDKQLMEKTVATAMLNVLNNTLLM